MYVRLLKPAIAATLVLGVLPLGASTVNAQVRTQNINTKDRAIVLAQYNAEFNRTEPGSGWDGDVAACRSGTTTSVYQLSVLQRVNWYRSMAGLPAVSYNTTLNQSAQDAALIGSAEGRLTHTPANTAKCYTQSGRTGAENSNLGLGVAGVTAVDGYIHDPGENNTAVGHRAWLLSRNLGTIATGDIESHGEHWAANAMYVTNSATASTPRDGYIAWPPSGYVPDAVLYDRWSFSTGGAGVSYQNASVTVTGPGGAVPVVVENRTGWLEAGIVFVPQLSTKNVSVDTTYTVAITGVTGGSQNTYTYQVTVIPANEPPREASLSSWGAASCTSPLSNISKVNLVDPEGDTTSYRLVAGYGDNDNGLFRVNEGGVIQNLAELDSTRTQYRLRYEATDTNGWVMQNTVRVTLKNPYTDPTTTCPGRNLTLSSDSKGVTKVTWDAPVAGAAGTWHVVFTPGGAYCAVTTLGCEVRTLQNGVTYKVDLYNVRSTWSSAHTVAYTKTTSPTSPPTTVVPALGTLKKGGTAKLSKYGKLPTGTKTYKTSGPCSVKRTANTVTASRARVGVCTVTVTATTRGKTGAVVRRTTKIRLRVV